MTDTLTLYELAEEATALDALTAMDDGEWTDEADALFDELAAKLVMKADSFGGYVKNTEAMIDAIKTEELRLTARRKALENKIASLKRYAMGALQRMDRDTVDGTIFTLKVQRNAPSVTVLVVADQLPPEYQRVVPATVTPDKTAIGQALKAGVEIDGCELTTTYSLRIK